MKDIKLLPCPFCGHDDIDPEEWTGVEGDKGPACSKCGALAESVEAWNMRNATPEAAQAGLTLDASEIAFLAARLRRLFAREQYTLPEFASENDAALIGIAGSVIGAILTRASAVSPAKEMTEVRKSLFADAARAAQSGQRASVTLGRRGEVPRGYALVPRVLTQKMDEAMSRALKLGSNQHLWDEAIAAAPTLDAK